MHHTCEQRGRLKRIIQAELMELAEGDLRAKLLQTQLLGRAALHASSSDVAMRSAVYLRDGHVVLGGREAGGGDIGAW